MAPSFPAKNGSLFPTKYGWELPTPTVKQHHTLTQIIMGLLNNGFELKVVEEAEPPKEMMDIPGMEDELRRPMMLLVKAIAKK